MDRRTVSINKPSYDVLSKFCKANTLVLSAWVEKILLQEIHNVEFIKNSDNKNEISKEILDDVEEITGFFKKHKKQKNW